MNSFLSKENQTVLKSTYIDGLKQSWKSQSMVDYCVKTASVFFPVPNGVACVEKPHIQTKFYFGYSDCGQGLSFEENNERVDNINAHLVDFFMFENLKDINCDIEICESILNDTDYNGNKYIAYSNVHYHSAPADCPCRSWSFVNAYDYEINQWRYKNTIPLTKNDVMYLFYALQEVKNKFEKRLQTYIKKYGTTKLSTNTYWIDD